VLVYKTELLSITIITIVLYLHVGQIYSFLFLSQVTWTKDQSVRDRHTRGTRR